MHVVLIALDSVGIDPLGHERPGSVSSTSTRWPISSRTPTASSWARETFAEIERFVGALVRALPADTRVVVTSDHGHLEQVGFTRGHPRSRVPTWVFGPGAHAVAPTLREPAAIFAHLASLA